MNLFFYLLIFSVFVFGHCLFLELSIYARTSKAIVSVTLISAIIWITLTIIYYGLGHNWSLSIFLLKFFSLYLAALIPFALSSAPYLIGTKYLEHRKGLLSIGLGIVGVFISPITALFFVCASTGDCL
jgi:hypothetical protein